MSASVTILWLRRDLRLADHPALIAAAEHAQKSGGTLLPIFIWESDLIRGPRSSTNRTWFLRESLAELTGELAARGSTLLELQGPATTAFPALVTELRAAGIGTGSIDAFITRDHTPYALARDRAVADALIPLNVSLHATRGLVVVEPDELLTGGGTAYGVYTPYFRRWIDLVVQRAERPPTCSKETASTTTSHTPACFAWIAKHSAASVPTAQRDLLPTPGERAARAAAERWISAGKGNGAGGYADRRNSLADAEGDQSPLSSSAP